MTRHMMALLAGVGAMALISGCSVGSQPEPKKPEVVVQKVDKAEIKKAIEEEKYALMMDNNMEKTFVVYGEGIAPTNTISPAQAMALAKRAAITDGYRQLGEKLFGIRVNAKETIKDAALRDSRITTQVNGLIKDAAVTDNNFKDGLYVVRMELTMSGKRWKEIFSY
ncbi:MAG: hypothetical protein PHN38_00970 [Sulfurospirillaceae bacterium]|nr:hypothetical protein [Sulfurospirillaceae bacterium]MDD3462793.1 hypothetical protein [Sulfurospirillaceae bacterium]